MKKNSMRSMNVGPFLSRLPAATLLLLLRIYQRTLSPALPVLTLGRCGCRFSPTCSHYAADAIRAHGALAGTLLAAARLVKCTPLHPGGFDPVPPRRIRRGADLLRPRPPHERAQQACAPTASATQFS